MTTQRWTPKARALGVSHHITQVITCVSFYNTESEQSLVLDAEQPLHIIFISGNKWKLEEVQRFVGEELMQFVTNFDIDLEEIQGDEEEVVLNKVRKQIRTPV